MKLTLGPSIAVSLFLTALVSCGGGSSSDIPAFSLSTSPSMNQSITAFNEVVPFVGDGLAANCACGDPALPCRCPCPGGGDVDVSAADDGSWFTMNFDGCVSDDGLAYTGTVEGVPDENPDATLGSSDLDYNRENIIITYDLPAFGACTDVNGSILMAVDHAEGTDTCQGTLYALCDNESVTCDIVADCTSCM